MNTHCPTELVRIGIGQVVLGNKLMLKAWWLHTALLHRIAPSLGYTRPCTYLPVDEGQVGDALARR
jgi:hypothetical protein